MLLSEDSLLLIYMGVNFGVPLGRNVFKNKISEQNIFKYERRHNTRRSHQKTTQ
jgi:hypothetical protein